MEEKEWKKLFMNADSAIKLSQPSMDIKCWGDHRPKRGTEESAGIDLYNNGEDISLIEGIPQVINTKTAMAIPPGHVGLVFVRSGFGFKGLRLTNGTGVIDSDYRGEILVKVILDNDDEYKYVESDGIKHLDKRIKNRMDISKGTRFAQIVIIPVYMLKLNFVDELDDTKRGVGGIGSTGTE